MKKKNKIGKIIKIILFTLVIMGIAYIGTYYIDKYKREKGTININVVYDDTITYIIPSTKVKNKEEALKDWPYMFTVESTGNKKGIYQIIIKDIETSTIKREKLSYLLVLNDITVKEGKLSDIKNDILYQKEIGKNTNQKYKIYIWVDSEIESENLIYEYQITLNAIKEGGPGFK